PAPPVSAPEPPTDIGHRGAPPVGASPRAAVPSPAMTGRATHGIIAAGHVRAADAAAAILAEGGNAFDAIIAAGCASSVCEPGFTSLAGGGFLLARSPGHGDVLFDF